MITTSVNSLATYAIKPSLTSARGGARRPQWITVVTPISSTSRLQTRQYGIAHPAYGSITPQPEKGETCLSKTPFRFETGYALRPKRPSRPFPPPFVSIPSSSFSDPLTTHSQNQDRRPSVGGEPIRGLTNGDDAVLAAENLIGVNDGVGAWAMKPQGHAALWSRLILHFWALECERKVSCTSEPDTVEYLQHAFEETKHATNQWLGTTTSVTALLHSSSKDQDARPLLCVTNIGDCQILVIRPREKKILFKTREQWHWFDCPYQLGTNSVDEPKKHAVFTKMELEENDIVVAVSDGVIDNLWEHEVLSNILDSLDKWEAGEGGDAAGERDGGAGGGMVFAARRLMNAALSIAQDPFAESPYMEKAIDEGLSIEGGKMDDISVVIGLCKRRPLDTS